MDRAIEEAMKLTNPYSIEVFNPSVFDKEVIDRQRIRNDPTAIILKSGRSKFKNKLTKNNANVEQELKFVRYPLTYNSHIIYCDGTTFRYLKLQSQKMRSNFVKTFPKLLGWNAHEWYKFHLTLEARACEYFLWVMPTIYNTLSALIQEDLLLVTLKLTLKQIYILIILR